MELYNYGASFRYISRQRQLLDADHMSDWPTKQLAYGIFGASYSRRLFGYDLVGNDILNKALLDFLLFREPLDESWTDIIIPPVVRKWFSDKLGIENRDSIEIPEGKSEEEAIEDLCRIWFEVMTSSPGFSGFPSNIFTNADVARKFQNRARNLGIEHMLEAWSKKVPLSDIVA